MKKFLIIMLSIILALSLSACGGKTPAQSGNTGGNGDLPDKLICGVTLYEPMNYKDSSGNWTGFDTEFALLVGEKLGIDVEFQQITWGNKYIELESGTINAIWNGFTANATESSTGELRTDIVDMSYAYMINKQCLVIKADNAGEFASVDDLAGKTIAVESGSAGESLAADVVGGDGKVLSAPAQINTFTEVKAGTSDCAIVDFLLAQRIAGSGNFDDLVISVIEFDIVDDLYAIGFKKDDPLRDSVNKAVKELYDDGTLAALAEKYDILQSLILRENIH